MDVPWTIFANAVVVELGIYNFITSGSVITVRKQTVGPSPVKIVWLEFKIIGVR